MVFEAADEAEVKEPAQAAEAEEAEEADRTETMAETEEVEHPMVCAAMQNFDARWQRDVAGGASVAQARWDADVWLIERGITHLLPAPVGCGRAVDKAGLERHAFGARPRRRTFTRPARRFRHTLRYHHAVALPEAIVAPAAAAAGAAASHDCRGSSLVEANCWRWLLALVGVDYFCPSSNPLTPTPVRGMHKRIGCRAPAAVPHRVPAVVRSLIQCLQVAALWLRTLTLSMLERAHMMRPQRGAIPSIAGVVMRAAR